MARRVRTAARIVVGVVSATVAGAALGGLLLAAAARGHAAWLGSAGATTVFGGWTFAAAYALLGLALGAVVGLTLGIGRALARVLAEVRPALQAESTRLAADGGRLRIATSELRQRWEHVADEAVARSIGAVRVPGAGLVARLVRARLRHGMVDDFLAECDREGVNSVGPSEIGRWVAAQGPTYLLAPVYAQLWALRVGASVLMVAAAAAPWLITLAR
jgi:hypothetical protein